MGSSASGPRTRQVFAAFRYVTSWRSRRFERQLQRNQEWIEQVRNAPTMGERLERERSRGRG